MKLKRKYYLNKILIIIFVICLVVIGKDSALSFAFLDNEEINISDVLEFYFFDVGQADSILVKQNHNTVLIDAGNNEDGKYIVKYLNYIGLEDIDLVVGTHPHEDHIGGLDDVIDNFLIGEIYMPDAISTSKTFEDVLVSIEYKNYFLNIPQIDSEIQLGDMIFKVLYTGNDENDLNNTSIVLKLIFGNTSYLVMGDATSNTERLILNKNIRANVLKVGHHGSKYSTTNEFLNKVDPMYAIIMVGNDNNYGHPTKEVLNKLKKKNTIVYRTDIDGTIKLTSDGNNINIETLDISLNG